MEEFNIFISSPGDVKEERKLVRQLAKRITERSNNQIKLNAYNWEDDQLFLATRGGYQTNISRSADPANFDLLLLILWSRLGTPLDPNDFDQTHYNSGTEYEYLRATQAYKERKEKGETPLKPDVLIFRRVDKILPPAIDLNDPASLEKAQEFNRQAQAVVAFFRTHIEPQYNKAAYHQYSITNESNPQSRQNSFAGMLEHCLIEWVKSKLRERGKDPDLALRLKSWHDSPFRALEVFEEKHETIYFGRDQAQHQVMDQFKSQYQAGSPFVLIYGASGSGKSSLLRAGLIPKFRGGGVVDGVSGWNIFLFVASKVITQEGDAGKPDLIRALAEALLTAVPNLQQGTTTEKLVNDLKNGALENVVRALTSALEDQRNAGREQPSVSTADPIRIFIALDQMEELFTIPGLPETEINAFFSILSHLVRSRLVGVIGTMRSDFYHRCDTISSLASLTTKSGSYRLIAPTSAEIGEMIRKPAELADLRFEIDKKKGPLDDVILREALNNPDSLPLLEYALQLLYEEGHENGLLTHANYEKIGGVDKAIATQAQATLVALKKTAEKEKWSLDDAFDTVFRRLIFLNDGAEGQGPIVTKRAVVKKELETVGPGPERLVEVFCQARLFATDETTLTVAHEALLSRWNHLKLWIEKNQDFFREVRILRRQQEAYEQSGNKADWLLRGQPLKKALELRKTYLHSLEIKELQYIDKSARHARRQSLQARVFIALLAGLILVLVAVAWNGGQNLAKLWERIQGGIYQTAFAPGYRQANAKKVEQCRTNSLGMTFIEAGTPGCLFSVYDVRVKDWREFARSTQYGNPFTNNIKGRGTADSRGNPNMDWESPFSGYKQSDDDPAVKVSWDDAVAFCDWLTRKERAENKLDANAYYDLPTDSQWSRAIGLSEPDAGSPKDKDGKTAGYPWGPAWPPPFAVGNYEEGLTHDGFSYTSPVGSFASFHYSLCDIGGNVWQWCKDDYEGGINYDNNMKVLRGGSWGSFSPGSLASSYRFGVLPGARDDDYGFRVVLVVAPSSSPLNEPPSSPVITPAPKSAIAPVATPPPVAASKETASKDDPWINSLGMKFVPAGTNGVLFSIWDVRVKDFTTFVDATGYDATGGMYSVTKGDWGQSGATWRDPGFNQTEQDPVVGVSWDDAKAFCAWLTLEDRKQGVLTANQDYRLPMDAEWSQAVGLNEGNSVSLETKGASIQKQYPWGDFWPPPLGVGNYAGSEARDENWPASWGILAGYRDDYPRTSPVGSFPANAFGLYDMGGDVWQFCEDYYNGKDGKKIVRGGSWGDSSPLRLASAFRNKVALSGYRDDCLGFRVVLVIGPSE